MADETVWTIEDGFLCVVLVNAKSSVSEEMWESLLADGSFAPDPLTLLEMRKNLDLEKFQIEVTFFFSAHPIVYILASLEPG